MAESIILSDENHSMVWYSQEKKEHNAHTHSLSIDSEYGITSPIDEYYRESIFETGTNNRHVYE